MVCEYPGTRILFAKYWIDTLFFPIEDLYQKPNINGENWHQLLWESQVYLLHTQEVIARKRKAEVHLAECPLTK